MQRNELNTILQELAAVLTKAKNKIVEFDQQLKDNEKLLAVDSPIWITKSPTPNTFCQCFVDSG